MQYCSKSPCLLVQQINLIHKPTSIGKIKPVFIHNTHTYVLRLSLKVSKQSMSKGA